MQALVELIYFRTEKKIEGELDFLTILSWTLFSLEIVQRLGVQNR